MADRLRGVTAQHSRSFAPHSGQSIMLVIGRTDQEANQQHDNEDHQGICTGHGGYFFPPVTAERIFSPVSVDFKPSIIAPMAMPPLALNKSRTAVIPSTGVPVLAKI